MSVRLSFLKIPLVAISILLIMSELDVRYSVILLSQVNKCLHLFNFVIAVDIFPCSVTLTLLAPNLSLTLNTCVTKPSYRMQLYLYLTVYREVYTL